jgi:Rieske Fe-S protein
VANNSDDPGQRGGQAGLSDEARRDFLKIIGIGTIGTGVLAASAVPVAGAVIYPLHHETTKGSNQLIAVGKPDLFEDGKPSKVDLYADKVDAWNRVVQVKIGSAWVIKEGDKLTAYSTVCPHLGCGISWDGDKEKFVCPCHHAVFSKDGKVEDGPPRRGMDELDVQVDPEGLVSIHYKRFKTGIAEKEPA